MTAYKFDSLVQLIKSLMLYGKCIHVALFSNRLYLKKNLKMQENQFIFIFLYPTTVYWIYEGIEEKKVCLYANSAFYEEK